MDDERARGRARSLAARRAKAFAHAQAMLPVIEQARTEETQRSGDWTYRSLADWLNARDHKTLRGKAWRHQSVWELLHIEHGQIDQAQIERDEKLAVLRRGAARLWRGRFESDDVREARRKIDEEFSATVLHAKAMGAALRGERHHLRDRIKRTPTAGPQGDATSSA